MVYPFSSGSRAEANIQKALLQRNPLYLRQELTLGLEGLQRTREIEPNGALPVIILLRALHTDNSQKALVNRIFEQGGDEGLITATESLARELASGTLGEDLTELIATPSLLSAVPDFRIHLIRSLLMNISKQPQAEASLKYSKKILSDALLSALVFDIKAARPKALSEVSLLLLGSSQDPRTRATLALGSIRPVAFATGRLAKGEPEAKRKAPCASSVLFSQHLY
jgi:hypothetical protein